MRSKISGRGFGVGFLSQGMLFVTSNVSCASAIGLSLRRKTKRRLITVYSKTLLKRSWNNLRAKIILPAKPRQCLISSFCWFSFQRLWMSLQREWIVLQRLQLSFQRILACVPSDAFYPRQQNKSSRVNGQFLGCSHAGYGLWTWTHWWYKGYDPKYVWAVAPGLPLAFPVYWPNSIAMRVVVWQA